MSHFIGLVFGENVDGMLEQYDEGLEVDPHLEYDFEQAKEEALSTIKNIEKYGINIPEEIKDKLGWPIEEKDYPEFVALWNNLELREDGVYSTYNYDAKWDWYQQGGRFSEWLKLKDEDYSTSFAEIGEVDWDKTRPPFCFVTEEGEWIEKGKMGWWCLTENEKDDLTWEEEFKEYVKSLPEDMPVTVIDFHI